MSETGTVRKWLMDKGFGFIARADGTEIFCHHKDTGGINLNVGDIVSFDIGDNPGKEGIQSIKAVNVSGGTGEEYVPIGKGKGKGDKGGKGAWAAVAGAPIAVMASPYGAGAVPMMVVPKGGMKGGKGPTVVQIVPQSMVQAVAVGGAPAAGKGKGGLPMSSMTGLGKGGAAKGGGGKGGGKGNAWEEHGWVKNFNEEKGYGFITSDAGDDVFYHCKACNGGSLIKDLEVWFTRGIAPKNGKVWAENLRGPGFQGKPVQGTVKLWNKDKGFGFITAKDNSCTQIPPRPDGSPGDIFVHVSAVQAEKHDGSELLVGEDVEFTVGATKDGKPCALNVCGPGCIRNGQPVRAPAEKLPPASSGGPRAKGGKGAGNTLNTTKGAAGPHGCAVGDAIEGCFNGDWCPATITGIKGDLTNVRWDDGSLTEGLPANCIRPAGGAVLEG
eukprot:TRINITY_DN4280_c0_g2_i1.p1 TRINITY_DN4280_c0_g2~~TRINITY_DN4280_c0_g2_i1.p1  ORF type:complete len:472 (+),score=180.73 TRINITY_DN4280_c0_g2_i1:94-1416(+)